MENDIGGIFLIVEYYLKNQGIVQNITLTIDDKYLRCYYPNSPH